jgi:hypothetical protein
VKVLFPSRDPGVFEFAVGDRTPFTVFLATLKRFLQIPRPDEDFEFHDDNGGVYVWPPILPDTWTVTLVVRGAETPS